MTPWTEPDRCAICGWTDKRDLNYGLVHWLDAPAGMAYEHVVRCLNAEGCRKRIELQGDVWPLVESVA